MSPEAVAAASAAASAAVAAASAAAVAAVPAAEGVAVSQRRGAFTQRVDQPRPTQISHECIV